MVYILALVDVVALVLIDLYIHTIALSFHVANILTSNAINSAINPHTVLLDFPKSQVTQFFQKVLSLSIACFYWLP